MANILVWGKTRDLIAGEIPAGIATDEVETLAAVQAVIEGKGSTLVLADPARLDAEKGALETWIRAGGNRRALLVAAADAAEADALIHRFPFLDDVLIKPLTATRLRLRLDRALDTINSRRVIEQLDDALVRKSQELHELNNIGVALSAQRDIDKLLELILLKCREITAADAGSLYLVERGKDSETHADDKLWFKLPQNDSVPVGAFEESEVPLSEASIAGYAALSGQIVNVADAYHLPAWFALQGQPLVRREVRVPHEVDAGGAMRDHQNTVIGVIQLINKKRDARVVLQPVQLVEEAVIPFTSVDEELVTSLASQAAVAFENARLIQDIKDLFDALREGVGHRDRVTRSHHLRPLHARGHAHRRHRGEAGRRSTPGPSAESASRATSSRRSNTRASSTTSARSACARRSSSRARSSTSARCCSSGSASPTSSAPWRPSTCAPSWSSSQSGPAAADLARWRWTAPTRASARRSTRCCG